MGFNLKGIFQVLPQRSDVPRRSPERGETEKEEDAAAEAEEEEQAKPSRGGGSREEGVQEGG